MQVHGAKRFASKAACEQAGVFPDKAGKSRYPSTAKKLPTPFQRIKSLRIAGFPQEYGFLHGPGWENDKRFYVSLSPGVDFGIVVYIDLGKKEVTEVKHWAAF
jgi:hypothetical protein